MTSVVGKVVLVTGAGSGIGQVTTRLLCERGARVSLVDISKEGMLATVKGVPSDRIMLNTVDVTQLSQVEEVIDRTVAHFGRLTGIVHCAGVSSRRPIASLNRESFMRILDVNFFSLVDLVRIATKKKYFEDGGSIVAMSSISSFMGYKAKTEYCVSKAAIDAFVRCAALEYANRGIRINTIMPGEVLTPMAIRAREINEALGVPTNMAPLGSSQPEEVANTIVFLLSDATKTITGTSIVIDGGATI